MYVAIVFSRLERNRLIDRANGKPSSRLERVRPGSTTTGRFADDLGATRIQRRTMWRRPSPGERKTTEINLVQRSFHR